jgi:hypothetical protein
MLILPDRSLISFPVSGRLSGAAFFFFVALEAIEDE